MIEEKLLGKAKYHAFVYVKIVFGLMLAILPILISLIVAFTDPRYFRRDGEMFVTLDIIFLVVGLGIVIRNMRYIYNRLNIYNKKITCVLGIFSRREVSILIRNVDSVEFYKSFLGRLFNYGNIVICSSRRTFRFGMIANAEEIMSLIVNAQDLLEAELMDAQTNAIIRAVKGENPVEKKPQGSVILQAPVSENVATQSVQASPVGMESTVSQTTEFVQEQPVEAAQKRCRYCGAVLENATKFCSVCGKKIEDN